MNFDNFYKKCVLSLEIKIVPIKKTSDQARGFFLNDFRKFISF